jgi:alpha/beta superfamily hydrolase
MHNKVVYRIAKAFQGAGFAVLRFNFRGTGRSQGEHDQGRGEQDDLRAAVNFMKEKYPNAEAWIAGFSFGSTVMLRAACGDTSIRAIVAAGVPVSKSGLSDVISCDKPKLFIQGELDQYGLPEDLARFVGKLREPKTLKIIEGADHFFEGHLAELEKTVSDFINTNGGERG